MKDELLLSIVTLTQAASNAAKLRLVDLASNVCERSYTPEAKRGTDIIKNKANIDVMITT